MTDTDQSDTLGDNEQLVEVSLAYIYTTSDGKVVNRMLKFFVNEKQYNQFENQTATLATL